MTQKKEIKKTRVRKKFPGPKKENRWELLEEYLSGKIIYHIAEERKLDPVLTRDFIRRLIAEINAVHQAQSLISAQDAENYNFATCRNGKTSTITKPFTPVEKKVVFASVRDIDRDINESFAPLLSDPESPILTDNEITYAQYIVNTNDWKEALEAAGFMEGLKTASGLGQIQGANTAARLRHFYLKNKPNISTFIRELQLKNLRDYKMDKEKIQGSLLQRIKVIEESNEPRLESTLAKYYHLLGQTTGAFTEKIEIKDISIDDVVNKMLQMRKAKSKNLIQMDNSDPTNSEQWEYVGDGYEQSEDKEVPDQVEKGSDFDEE